MKNIGEARPRREAWGDILSEHKQSGLSVRAFCKRRGVSEASLYYWRKRLSERQPVRFALVETNVSHQAQRAPVELVLANGDRLQIATGVETATLRTVLSVLRERA
jgi:transposase-like protein